MTQINDVLGSRIIFQQQFTGKHFSWTIAFFICKSSGYWNLVRTLLFLLDWPCLQTIAYNSLNWSGIPLSTFNNFHYFSNWAKFCGRPHETAECLEQSATNTYTRWRLWHQLMKQIRKNNSCLSFAELDDCDSIKCPVCQRNYWKHTPAACLAKGMFLKWLSRWFK